MSDYGVKISLPGVNVQENNPTSQTTNLNFPNLKLDTQNTNAFQSILLLITNDPPEPSSPGDKFTTVYKFAHGYTYVPSVETLFTVKSAAPGTVFYQSYFQDMGIVASQNVGSFVTMYASSDETNVYFIVDKTDQMNIGPAPNLLTGLTMQISCHVFLDDIGV